MKQLLQAAFTRLCLLRPAVLPVIADNAPEAEVPLGVLRLSVELEFERAEGGWSDRWGLRAPAMIGFRCSSTPEVLLLGTAAGALLNRYSHIDLGVSIVSVLFRSPSTKIL